MGRQLGCWRLSVLIYTWLLILILTSHPCFSLLFLIIVSGGWGKMGMSCRGVRHQKQGACKTLSNREGPFHFGMRAHRQ